MLLWTFMYTFLFKYIFPVLLGRYLGVELEFLSFKLIQYLIFWGTAKLLSKEVASFDIPIRNVWGFQFLPWGFQFLHWFSTLSWSLDIVHLFFVVVIVSQMEMKWSCRSLFKYYFLRESFPYGPSPLLSITSHLSFKFL